MNLFKIAIKDLKEFLIQKNYIFNLIYKFNNLILWFYVFYSVKYEYCTIDEFI